MVKYAIMAKGIRTRYTRRYDRALQIASTIVWSVAKGVKVRIKEVPEHTGCPICEYNEGLHKVCASSAKVNPCKA